MSSFSIICRAHDHEVAGQEIEQIVTMDEVEQLQEGGIMVIHCLVVTCSHSSDRIMRITMFYKHALLQVHKCAKKCLCCTHCTCERNCFYFNGSCTVIDIQE